MYPSTMYPKDDALFSQIQRDSFAANAFWQSSKNIKPGDVADIADHCSMRRIQSGSLWDKLMQYSQRPLSGVVPPFSDQACVVGSPGRVPQSGEQEQQADGHQLVEPRSLQSAPVKRPKQSSSSGHVNKHDLFVVLTSLGVPLEQRPFLEHIVGTSSLEYLGQGSFGTVYKGTVQSGLQRAIKFSRGSMTELETLRNVQRPKIVTMIEGLWLNGVSLLVMELGDMTLRKFAEESKESNSLPTFVQDVAEGLLCLPRTYTAHTLSKHFKKRPVYVCCVEHKYIHQ